MKTETINKNNMIINAFRIEEKLQSTSSRNRIIELINRIINVFVHLFSIYKYGIKKTLILVKTDINPNYIQDYDWITEGNIEYEINYKIQNEFKGKKIAVYTSIFGNYDSIKDILYKNQNIDYYIITDLDVSPESGWIKKEINDNEFLKMDNYHKSKYCKLHPHMLFPDYDYSIWIDGNVQVVADLLPLIDRLNPETSMATFQNPLHNCIYTEKKFIIYHDAAKTNEIEHQINEYRRTGFPKQFGMREFSIIVRKHNDVKLKSLMEQWWNEVNSYTMRDQISLPYILWRNGLSIDYIQLLGENWRYNPRFISVPHNWRVTYQK